LVVVLEEQQVMAQVVAQAVEVVQQVLEQLAEVLQHLIKVMLEELGLELHQIVVLEVEAVLVL
jgi:hypothetical protein